jgi:hypothetical protein
MFADKDHRYNKFRREPTDEISRDLLCIKKQASPRMNTDHTDLQMQNAPIELS